MDIILGAIFHVLYCLALFWVLFCGRKGKLYWGLLKKYVDPSFAILIPQENYNLNSVSDMVDTNWCPSNRDGLSCFYLVLQFSLNTAYAYCAELHLILTIKGGHFLILTVCVSGRQCIILELRYYLSEYFIRLWKSFIRVF